ncbi:MAG: DUF3568 family protein [Planctomycetota bacterium]|jgi:hypothetical protein
MNRKILISLTILLGSFALVLCGCASPIVGADAEVGGYVWKSGKLYFATADSTTRCHEATLKAFEDLGITVTTDTTDMLSGTVRGETSTEKIVTVDLEPTEMNITRISIRLDVRGNHAQSINIARKIKSHLLAADAE